VRLKAHAIDRDALRLQPADDLVQSVGLRTDALGADLVEVELRVAVGGARGAKRVGDVAGAQAAQEDRVAQAAAIGDRFVDDVPHPDVRGVALHDGADVLARRLAQVVGAELPDPRR